MSKKVYCEKFPFEGLQYGINTGLISEEFNHFLSELLCSICNSLVWNPVLCKSCEKPFCSKCIESWVKTNNGKCPNQCTYESKEISRTLKNILNKIVIICMFSINGCDQKVAYEYYEDHLKKCDFCPWKCLGLGCDYVNSKENAFIHSQNCSKIVEVCNHCKKHFKIVEFLQHFENCDMATENCMFCDTDVPRRLHNEHTREVCTNAIVKKYEELIRQLKLEQGKYHK